METYIAFLRAVNVGGTGKLPMSDLKAMCEAIGFRDVRTFIASGNVVFRSNLNKAKVRSQLEAKLMGYAGKPVGVHVRTATEISTVLNGNPFPDAPGNRNVVIFLDAPPPLDTIAKATGQVDEKIALGLNEIHVHYSEGMAQSKLKIPAAKNGTARNMNTVAKLAAMSNE